MSHRFKIPLTKPKGHLMQDAATLLPKNGFQFTSGTDGGRISGNGFEGSFHFVDQEMEIEITKKPFFAPWSLVEAKIRDSFRR